MSSHFSSSEPTSSLSQLYKQEHEQELEDVIVFNDCQDALVGIMHPDPWGRWTSEAGAGPVAVYSYERLVQVFEKQGMSYEEAVEWVDFNVAGAYVGPRTPVIVFDWPWTGEEGGKG